MFNRIDKIIEKDFCFPLRSLRRRFCSPSPSRRADADRQKTFFSADYSAGLKSVFPFFQIYCFQSVIVPFVTFIFNERRFDLEITN